MQVAQSLYENGHITYMRTDSTNLAKVAIEAARELVGSQYGREYPARPSRASIRPRSRTPRKPTKRFARPAIRSRFPKQLRGAARAPTSSGSTT